MSSTPGYRPTLLSRALRALLLWLHHREGWRASGAIPADRRGIIIGAPHTSNWDFVNFLGVTSDLGIRPRFMGKHSLFRWPMTRFMRDMGGVAVVRSASHDYVAQMIDRFREAGAAGEEFLLVIAPEGTRKGVRRWRTGFYHIALGAGVPIICGFLDYPRRHGGLGLTFMPSGDYRADMARVATFYQQFTSRVPRPEAATLGWIMGED